MMKGCAGGIFKLELFLPDDYPMTPPKIRFLTKIFHPNVDKLGRICLDVLKSMCAELFPPAGVSPSACVQMSADTTNPNQIIGPQPCKSEQSFCRSRPC